MWDAASGPVWSYNLYPGDLLDLRTTHAYNHQKTFPGTTFTDAPDTSKGCDVATGPGLTARFDPTLPAALYLLLVAADAAGAEGPYAIVDGVDIHDPSIDPRPASFFCP